jgi:hypothetical protein
MTGVSIKYLNEIDRAHLMFKIFPAPFLRLFSYVEIRERAPLIVREQSQTSTEYRQHSSYIARNLQILNIGFRQRPPGCLPSPGSVYSRLKAAAFGGGGVIRGELSGCLPATQSVIRETPLVNLPGLIQFDQRDVSLAFSLFSPLLRECPCSSPNKTKQPKEKDQEP